MGDAFHIAWEPPGTADKPPTREKTSLYLEASAARREALRFRNERGSPGALMGNNRLRPLNVIGNVRQGGVLVRWLKAFCKSTVIVTERRVGERFPVGPERPSTAVAMRETISRPAREVHWRLSPVIEMVLALARQYEPSTFDDILFTAGPNKRTPFAERPPALAASRYRRKSPCSGILFGNRWSLLVYESRWQGELLRLTDSAGNPARNRECRNHAANRGHLRL